MANAQDVSDFESRVIGSCSAARRRGGGAGRLLAFRAGIAGRIQDLADFGDSLIRRQAVRWDLPGDIQGVLARMRIGPVLRPAVLLAFVDRSGVLQHIDRPPAQRADRRMWRMAADRPVADSRPGDQRSLAQDLSATLARMLRQGRAPSSIWHRNDWIPWLRKLMPKRQVPPEGCLQRAL